MEKEKKKPYTKRERAIWKLARIDDKLRDGELELDKGAVISEGDDNGAYIQTWMWVPFEGTVLDKER